MVRIEIAILGLRTPLPAIPNYVKYIGALQKVLLQRSDRKEATPRQSWLSTHSITLLLSERGLLVTSTCCPPLNGREWNLLCQHPACKRCGCLSVDVLEAM